MFSIILYAGMGNYFYPFFVFRELAKNYGQEIEFIEQHSNNKGVYTFVVDELHHEASTRLLYENSSEASIKGDFFSDEWMKRVREYYEPKRSRIIDIKDIVFGEDGRISLKDESLLDAYEVFICRFSGTYNENTNKWLLEHRDLFSGQAELYFNSVYFDRIRNASETSVGIHIRYFKMIRFFKPGILASLINGIIKNISESRYKGLIFIFSDSIDMVKSMVDNNSRLCYVDLPFESPRRDFYELLLFSACKYRVTFDFTSFAAWARLLAPGSIDHDLQLSVNALGRVSWFFGKRALKLGGFSYKLYMKYVLNCFSRIIKNWTDKLSSNYSISEGDINNYLCYRNVVEHDEGLIKLLNDFELESYLQRRANESDDLEHYRDYERVLVKNGRNNKAYIVQQYIENTIVSVDIVFYFFIRLDAEYFTCVTDYMEDIGIILTYMGYNVVFVISKVDISANNYYQMDINEDFFNGVKTFKKCNYILYDTFVNKGLDNNKKNICLFKETDYQNVDGFKGIKILFNNCKWYDKCRNANFSDDERRDSFNTADIIYSAKDIANDIPVGKKYIRLKEEPVICEVKKRKTIEERQEADEWTLDVVKSILKEVSDR